MTGASTEGLSPDEKRALLKQLLQKKLAASREAYPLSYGQKAMWFLHELAPDSPAYHVAVTLRVDSPIDRAAFRRAWQSIVDRHAILRTTFESEGGVPSQVVAGYREVALEEIEAAGWSEDNLRRRVEADYEQPFDLEHGPALRVSLYSQAPDRHVLLVTAHHIVLDGWSVWILLDDLFKLYDAERQGRSALLPAAESTFASFVAWEAQRLAGPDGERLWDFWKSELALPLPTLELPVARQRPALQTFEGATVSFTLPAELTVRLQALARSEGTTLFTLLMTAYQTLLLRYSGQEDLLVGFPSFGRDRPEYANVVGDFINMVVLRGDLSGAPTFRALLSRMHGRVLAAIEHQDFPFPLLVERLASRADPSRSPVFQVVFDLQRIQRVGALGPLMVQGNDSPVDLGGLSLRPYLMSQQEGQFDLVLQLVEIEGSLHGGLKFNTDLFSHATIERMAGHYRTLLESVLADPDRPVNELEMLPASERDLILNQWNATRADYPAERCVHQAFEAQAARVPAKRAVTFAGASWTYRELNRRANQLARHLQTLGVGPGVLVALSLERSLEMLAAVLGVFKAGGAYVPLDPAYPMERLTFMLEDSGAPVLLLQESLRERWEGGSARIVSMDADWSTIAREDGANLDTVMSSSDLAYVLYTSGSTGRPKGAQISHRSLSNLLEFMSRGPGLTSEDVWVAVTTLSFDIAAVELILPLWVGAHVVIASREVAADGAQLQDLLIEHECTALFATPMTWRLLLAAGWREGRGLKAFTGGEALPPDLAEGLLSRGVDLWNLYGPTETTILSTAEHVATAQPPISIGRPIANTRVYVLDAQLKPVPIGSPGELMIGGDGLARGYLNRPELTAEKFAPDPYGPVGSRLYHTGDLARYLEDGRLEVIGRLDHQVKIRGYRIELGEIEATLARHPQVRQVIVMAREDRPGDRRLAAYIVPAPHTVPEAGELRDLVRSALPDYMVPTSFILMESLPQTPNGKVDRNALPAPDAASREPLPADAAPTSDVEMLLADLWKDVLGVKDVGRYDNFFDLGGHSLGSVQVVTRMAERTGIKLNPAEVRTQTLGQLAAAYDSRRRRAMPARLEQQEER